MIRKCTKCNKELDENHFRVDKNRKSGFHPYCKDCEYVYKKEWYLKNTEHIKQKTVKWQKENKEQLSAQKKEWRKKNPDKQKAISLRQSFGITLEQFSSMKEAQSNSCGICKNHEDNVGTLCVDHCHETGKIRGLLCSSCNKMLGFSKDKVDTLSKAIDYLNKEIKE